MPGPDKDGRPYDLETVVVNFANVGSSYGERVLKRDKTKNQHLFDWDGVRKCVHNLTSELGLKVVGCLFENWRGPDRSGPYVTMPSDIRAMCSSVQETPKLTGCNHRSADDEMTIKCAYLRNCRFMDNDNYRDWLERMQDEKVKKWLHSNQQLLQMRYFFDSDLGVFNTLDGNVSIGALSRSAR